MLLCNVIGHRVHTCYDIREYERVCCCVIGLRGPAALASSRWIQYYAYYSYDRVLASSKIELALITHSDAESDVDSFPSLFTSPVSIGPIHRPWVR